MRAIGEETTVNLRTGERFRRVVGGGESWIESLGIPGLRPLNEAERAGLAEYERVMREEAIPEMLKEERRRRRLAEETRRRVL